VPTHSHEELQSQVEVGLQRVRDEVAKRNLKLARSATIIAWALRLHHAKRD
jgi:hypothetical protein